MLKVNPPAAAGGAAAAADDVLFAARIFEKSNPPAAAGGGFGLARWRAGDPPLLLDCSSLARTTVKKSPSLMPADSKVRSPLFASAILVRSRRMTMSPSKSNRADAKEVRSDRVAERGREMASVREVVG